MNRICILIFLSFCHLSVDAQLKLSGTIRDADTGSPVDYVNIGILNRAQGTVSEDDGSFNWSIEDVSENDTIQISRIGYRPLQYSLKQMEEVLNENAVIIMQEDFTELEEVIIKPKDSRKNRVGYSETTPGMVAYWNNAKSLGGEHASTIVVRKGPVKLEDLSFEVVKNITDSLLVRVNVYEIEKGWPGKNITRQNILHIIKKESGKEIIDLSPYNIVVDNNFVVSLELLKIYGRHVGMTLAAFDDGYRSYTRLISQDRWYPVRKGTTITFNLNTSRVKYSRAAISKRKTKYDKPELVNIYWDQSLSMHDRSIDKEFDYLESFFDNLKDVHVVLQTFGYNLNPEKNFIIRDGNWSQLRSHLEQLDYDGGTRKSVLQKLQSKDFTLFFTDGMDLYKDVNLSWTGQTFAINSNNKANHEMLHKISEESGGTYIDLSRKYNLKKVADYQIMESNISHIYQTNTTQVKYRTILGNVTDFEDAVEQVLVRVKGSERKTRTDSDGIFKIQAIPGETLVFTYPGRSTVEALVNGGTSYLTIAMPVGVQVLDEVLLNKRIEATVVEGIAKGKEKITTNFGVLDPEKIGFAVKQISGDQLFQGANSIVEALDGKFSGVKAVIKYSESVQSAPAQAGTALNSSGDDPQGTARNKRLFQTETPLIALRGGEHRGLYAAWDVDGLFYQPEDVPFYIQMSNVKSITIMPGSWASSKYGRDAAGGIIIVRTISGSFGELEQGSESLAEHNKSRGNIYNDEAVFPEEENWQLPKYLGDLEEVSSPDLVYTKYIRLRDNWLNRPEFYYDVYKQMGGRLGLKDTADIVLSNLKEVRANDVIAMRLLAYANEEKGNLSNALDLYQSIVDLKPEELQSYRDLANIYIKTGAYKEGWDVYRKYLALKENSLEEDGLDKVVREEMLNVVQQFAETIEVDQSKFNLDNNMDDISIIVQWNNPNAEFELQFVGPTGHFYVWKHSLADNAKLLAKEQSTGSYTKGFSIQDIGEGPWMINTKYLGNLEGTASFLKFTIRNRQKNEESIKLIKLKKNDVNYRSLNISENEVISLFK